MTTRTELPDGCYNIYNDDGGEFWYNRKDEYHRLDGPALMWNDGDIAYRVNGKTPSHILDIVIIREEMDFEMFPSATKLSNYYDLGSRAAYRISDPDELTLAILRYGG